MNVSINSANKIHDDATAARYGFRGGLVAGTLVFAHMSTPLVRAFGKDWLDGSVTELKLLQPAYDGEWLTVERDPDAGDDGTPANPRYRLRTCNAGGAALATLWTEFPAHLPPVDERAGMEPAPPGTPVVPIDWDVVQVGRPLRALHWGPQPEEHARWCEHAGDPLPLYREAPRPRIQPGRMLQGANEVFSATFQLGPWIHTASRIVQRASLHLGDPIEIRAVPTEKWERKGHHFVTLYVVFLNAGAPAVEVTHTAIFRVRAA